MLQGEHSAILSTFIKLPFVIKMFVLSIFSGGLRQVLLYYPDIELKKHGPDCADALAGLHLSC